MLLFWKRSPQVRLLLIAAFLLYITGEGLTFQYFYPRNVILFGHETVDTARLQSILADWRTMNWVRSAIIVTGVICSALALNKTYLRLPAKADTAPGSQRFKAAVA